MLRKIPFLALATLLVLAAGQAFAQTTIQVNIGATPAASGTNLLNALAGIVDNSAAKPYVVKVNPGLYDVGATPVAMKPYVDIEGSGQAATTIQGLGNNGGGLVGLIQGANNAELRHLQAISQGAGFGYSIAVLLTNVTASVRDVTLVSSGATSNWGVRNLGSVATLQDLTINVSGGSTAYGIANTGASVSTTPAIRRAVINVSGSSQGNGIYADQSAAPSIRDVEIRVTGCPTGYGVRYAYEPTSSGFSVEVTNSKIQVLGVTSLGAGIDASGSNFLATVTHSNLTATSSFFSGGAAYGLRYSGSSLGTVYLVDHCDVFGGSFLFLQTAISAPTSGARIGASKLSGSVSVGAPVCAASFNNSYAALSAACL